MKKIWKVKKRYRNIILIILLAGLILKVEPWIVSEATGTPLWYLEPPLVPFSIISIGPENSLRAEVTPGTPTTLGEIVRVSVFGEETGAPVEGATVGIMKDGAFVFSKTTDENGIVEFEYPGETTIITVSKGTYLALRPCET